MSPTGDLPTMLAANYASNTYAGENLLCAIGNAALNNQRFDWVEHRADYGFNEQASMDARRILKSLVPKEKENDMPARRIVQVYIADPHEDVPLDQAVLYTGEQKLTDLTDQELFFEIDMKNILATHNAKRVKLVNKKVKDRTEYLEPARVRDLKMVVVTVASF